MCMVEAITMHGTMILGACMLSSLNASVNREACLRSRLFHLRLEATTADRIECTFNSLYNQYMERMK